MGTDRFLADHCRRLGALVVFTILIVAGGSIASRAARVMTVQDVAKLRYVGSVVISPDGRHVAYNLYVPRDPFEDDNGASWAELHVVGPDGLSRPFVTGHVNVGDIAWSPDGRGISFLCERDDDETKGIYLIPIDGGEARRIVEHDTDISGYSWSGDGKRIAFLATEETPKEIEDLEEDGFNQEIYEEDDKPVRVWVVDLEGDNQTPRMLDLPGSASTLEWCPVGNRLALTLAPTPLVDDRYMRRKIHVVDAVSGAIATRFDTPGKLGDIAWSPDGRYLAAIAGAHANDPREGRLTVGPADGTTLTDIMPGYEGHVCEMAWTDNETIRFLANQGVESLVGEIGRGGGTVRMIIPPEGGSDQPVPVPDLAAERPAMNSLSWAAGNGATAFQGESPAHPREVYYLPPDATEPVQLTVSNPWLAQRRLASQEVIEYQARDSLMIQGILIRPLDEEPGKRYPLIVHVHGGPESNYRNGWMTSYSALGQVFAGRGFAVFYPNYRASTGRGLEFSMHGFGDPAGKEFDDIVDGVSHLVETGLVDRDRVGVTGGSYGGYASAWCATYYSEYFAASVMFVGVSDQVSKIGTTDIPNEMIEVHFQRPPWEDWQFFLERSPIYYADQSRTPTLILHGKDDPRVNVGQSRELYRHLKMRGKAPVRLVLYPGEKHGNRKAAARYDYSLRLLRWMEHYLVGPGGEPPPYELEYPPLEEKG